MTWLALALVLAAPAPTKAPPTQREREVAASAFLCAYADSRADVMNKIARERRYSAVGGVVNMSKLYRWQHRVMEIDEAAEGMRESMRREGLAELSCSADDVRRVTLCVEVWVEDEQIGAGWLETRQCRSAEMRRYSRTVGS